MTICAIKRVLDASGARCAGVSDAPDCSIIHAEDGTQIAVWSDGTVSAQGPSARTLMLTIAEVMTQGLCTGEPATAHLRL